LQATESASTPTSTFNRWGATKTTNPVIRCIITSDGTESENFGFSENRSPDLCHTDRYNNKTTEETIGNYKYLQQKAADELIHFFNAKRSYESMHFSEFCVKVFSSTMGVGKIFFRGQ